MAAGRGEICGRTSLGRLLPESSWADLEDDFPFGNGMKRHWLSSILISSGGCIDMFDLLHGFDT